MRPSRCEWTWPALVALAALVAGVRSATCPSTCSCGMGLQLEYDCAVGGEGGGSVQLVLQPGEFLHVICTDLGTLPIHLPVGIELDNNTVASVSFTGCPSPVKGGWADVLNSLGFSGTRFLKLSALPVGTPPLSREHLYGLSELTSLWLENAVPPRLPQDLFADLPALRRLTLRGSLTGLNADMFAAVSSLELLEIAETNLTEVPANAFRGLRVLRRLGLWRAGLTRLDSAALSGLDALQELDLSSNALRSLSSGTLGTAKQLQRLRLNGNPLEVLETGTFAGLEHLKEVSVWDTDTTMTLRDGLLAALPALETVRVERCSLLAVPADLLLDSRALRSLSLAGNKLQAVPATLLQHQTGLLHLDLSRNEIKILDPEFFTPLRQLLTLDLDRNKIEELPERVFSGLAAVRNVSLQRNRLRNIAAGAFSGARALQSLVLARNNLTLRDPQAEAPQPQDAYVGFGFGAQSPFSALQSLRRLDLSYNRIAEVFADWRLLLLALSHLDLRHNAVDILTESDLNFLGEIVVDLRHNNISTVIVPEPSLLTAVTADGSPSSARVLLGDNPFVCDCRLYQLVGRLVSGSPASEAQLEVEGARCASPPALQDRVLVDVPRAALTCRLPAGDCAPHCNCTQRPGADLLELECEKPPDESAWPAPADWGLGASSLRLTAPPDSLDTLRLPSHVGELWLAELSLRELTGAAPPGLRLLDLADNGLRALPAALLANNNHTRLRLAGNPLLCDCDHADDLTLLQQWKSQVSDWETAQCVSGARVERLASVSADVLCSARRQLAALLALGVSAALLAALGAALCHRYELELRVWLAARGLLCCRAADPADRADRHKRYDAFVSYSHLDEEWVLNELVPRLEPALRLCVHFRDWIAGEFIPAQIARSVEESRRTIVVLSDNFLQSVWGRLEWRAAHVRALRERRARVVVLVLGELDPAGLEPELRAYLSTNTYVKVGDPWFWDKLQYALPRPGIGAGERVRDHVERSVLRKTGFDDRLPAPPVTQAPPAPPAALQVRLTADGQLVNTPGKLN